MSGGAPLDLHPSVPLPECVPRAIELLRVRLPMIEPFVSGHGVERDRDLVLVRAFGAEATEGWGECSALAQPTYTAEYTEGAWVALRDTLVPEALRGERQIHLDSPMASAAVEVACVDLALKEAGVSLAGLFGAARKDVPVGVVVGIATSVDELLAVVSRRIRAGYRQIKLKVAPGWAIEPLRAVRERWPDVALAADANGTFGLDRLIDLASVIDDLGLDYFEQPLPADDLAGLGSLAEVLVTPIALDESIATPADAVRALDQVPGAVLNLKLARVGGLARSREILAIAATHDTPLFVGGMLESGVGRAAALAVAAAPGCSLVSDLGPSDRYFEHDVTPPFLMEDGMLSVPTGPGIGVEIDLDLVEEHLVSRLLIEGPST